MINFIAEFCQNHLGNREILEQMIISAKDSGATHGKLQGLYSSELTDRERFNLSDNSIYRPYKIEFERLKTLDLSPEIEFWFVNKCKSLDLIPMITVFTHLGVERARNAGFRSIKIASYDCSSIPIIEKVLEFANEIVISTGATYWNEIAKTVQTINELRKPGQKVAFLHARTIYPTALNETGMFRMLALNSFGFDYGFSDHSMPDKTNLDASKIALIFGAKYIERHFTVLNKDQTKDGPVSINPEQMKELVDFSNFSISQKNSYFTSEFIINVMKCDSLDPSAQELINRDYYRGRVASKINGKLIYSWETA